MSSSSPGFIARLSIGKKLAVAFGLILLLLIGSFSATGSAQIPGASPAGVDGALVLDSAAFTFSGIPVRQQRPSRFDLTRGTIAMKDVAWAVADHPVLFSGSVGVASGDPTLDLSVNGIVDLRVLSAFTSAAAFDGSASVEARHSEGTGDATGA